MSTFRIFLWVLHVVAICTRSTPSPISIINNKMDSGQQLNASKEDNWKGSKLLLPVLPVAAYANSPWTTVPILFPGKVLLLSDTMLPWQHSSSQSRKSLAARSHPVVICRGADGRPFDGFPCDEEACVPVSWVCDGDADCTGGADEKRCGACAEDELRCEVRGATTCLAPRFLCDGRRDCYDGSDESPDRCNSHCDFRCGDSGRCISHSQVCDLDDDCDDGSDESDCHQQPAHDECHREFEFLCHDSLGEEKWHHCVPRVWVCDGHDDCPHGEDEYTDACNRKKALGAE